MLRLFFALQPTPAQAEDLLARTAATAALLHAQPVTADNLHATLCFVGAVAPERLDALKASAATVLRSSVELRFDALDYWEEPRVLCATSSEACEAANELARAISTSIVAAGFAPDRKPFRPHLTLARKGRSADAMKVDWPIPLESPLALRCDRFVLMESRREETGSIYSVQDSWGLDGDKPLRKDPE